MAEFSKQYLELKQWKDFPYDFDIEEEYNSLQKGSTRPIVCEGFGFWGLGLQDDGTKMVYIRNFDTEEAEWIEYETFIEDYKSKQAEKQHSFSEFDKYSDDVNFDELWSM